MSVRESVTVTGIGLVSPVGSTAADVFDAVCDGRSGLSRPPAGHPLHGVVDVAAFAPAIDPASVLPGPESRVVDRSIVMVLRAAEDALADAGLRIGHDVDPYRVAAVVSGVGGLSTLEEQVLGRAARGRFGVSPYMLPGTLPNMGAARIAIKFGIHGYTSSIGTACAAGAQSIGEALRILRAGEADVVLAGCAEAPLFPTFAYAFGNARALARGWADPAAASRPFDRRRNGLVLGEGAGVFVLERAAHAAARGAHRHADVLGWGATNDAHHPTTPRPDGAGAAACMRMAVRDAGLVPGDIGYVNAHGTSTRAGDAAELAALAEVYDTGPPPMSSTKGVTGHMLGVSGVIEAAIAVEALRRGLLPPTHNLDDPERAGEVDHIRAKARAVEVDAVLSNSFGFGGHNVSLVLARPA
ncbi:MULTISPECIES: beta-ketoacyl-[acyl-carrier-protein] synthase family protein [unclassified Micromonospora]|uniref:beta-ketoacyl-[acyl-carrier-protein] synthase family protein n=1 Tax=unclassified Micromonospora TaxID=2617518 RepID=UPI001C219BA4|nr:MULTISPECIES: beta-ketoacyl-[acyl-carrier-protein] synthase family protein [unclassified Micromonospora]MBU8861417.1 beta-ketoacyl-[acyl-carrier-protein] synthase family protein [Micromonospora sp. WMMB482]MDM4780979.1 beta-ketoacyl-[acyl-carrier-protein] synthase family protein [Micromonospora sp. b486]